MMLSTMLLAAFAVTNTRPPSATTEPLLVTFGFEFADPTAKLKQIEHQQLLCGPVHKHLSAKLLHPLFLS